MKLIGYQLKKANYILNNNYSLPELNEFYNINLDKLYDIQYEYSKNNKSIYVVNTFVFHIIEYNPKIILNNIKNFD